MVRAAALIAVLMLAACGDPSPEFEQKVKEHDMQSTARDLVRATLKDPDSAQFRNERISLFQGHSVACGEVNANNSFGGKAGFQRFVAASEQAVVVEGSMEPTEFEKVWTTIC